MGAQETLGLWLPVLRTVLYSFHVATYILGYDVCLITGKILTDENGEGSNAHALPCGVRGVRQRLQMCWQQGKRLIARPACTQALQCTVDGIGGTADIVYCSELPEA